MLGFRLNLARFADFRAVSLPVEAPTVGGRNALRVADRAHVSVGHANNGRDALCSQPSDDWASGAAPPLERCDDVLCEAVCGI